MDFITDILHRAGHDILRPIAFSIVFSVLVSHTRSKWTSCLSVKDSGIVVFQKPKILSVMAGVAIALCTCVACILGQNAYVSYPGPKPPDVVALLVSAAFLTVAIVMFIIGGPDIVAFDPRTLTYRCKKGWLRRYKTGCSTDFVGVTVVNDLQRGYASCHLNWASGGATRIGLWLSKNDGRHRAIVAAELLAEAAGVPITIKDVDSVKPSKRHR